MPTEDRDGPDRDRPPAGVRAAYGLTADPVPLPGGTGSGAWRVGDAGMKRLDLPAASLAWHADLLDRLDGHPDFRVTPLLRTGDGALGADGWIAWRFEEGDTGAGRWAEIVGAGRALHSALAGEPRPAFFDARDNPWATADRLAWGEVDPTDWARVPVLEDILPLLPPPSGGGQLIHADLTGNVLFAAGRPPLIIDLSPYWRPPGFAAAVVVVDALAWHDADLALAQKFPEVTPELLLRALTFRVATHHLLMQGRWSAADVARHRRVLDAGTRSAGR